VSVIGCDSLSVFKSRLKPFLFRKSYNYHAAIYGTAETKDIPQQSDGTVVLNGPIVCGWMAAQNTIHSSSWFITGS